MSPARSDETRFGDEFEDRACEESVDPRAETADLRDRSIDPRVSETELVCPDNAGLKSCVALEQVARRGWADLDDEPLIDDGRIERGLSEERRRWPPGSRRPDAHRAGLAR
jgi:hypothetical protein